MAKNQKNKDAVSDAIAKLAAKEGVDTKNPAGRLPESDTLEHFGMKTPDDYRILGDATIVQNDHFRDGALPFVQVQLNGNDAHTQAPAVFNAIANAAAEAGLSVGSREEARFQNTTIAIDLEGKDLEGSRKRFAEALERQVSKPGAEVEEPVGRQAGITASKNRG